MKATIRKWNGTVIEAEGTPEEIRRVAADDLPQPVQVPSAWTFTPVGCQHDFPSPWFGVVPPACRKCGMQALPAVTFTLATQASSDLRIPVKVGTETKYIHPHPVDWFRARGARRGPQRGYGNHAGADCLGP